MSQHKRPTQKQRVLRLLKEAGARGVRTNEFLAERLPRFGARIYELRNEGYVINQTGDPHSESGAIYTLSGRYSGVPVTRPRARRPTVESRINKLAVAWGRAVVSTRPDPASNSLRWVISGGMATRVFSGASLDEVLSEAERSIR